MQKTAVILTIHKFGPLEKERVLHLHHSLKNSADYDFHINCDTTHHSRYPFKWFAGLNIVVNRYSKADCKSRYPGRSYFWFSGIYKSPAKPAIPLWFESNAYEFAWVIEYDACFTGDWKVLFDRYLKNQSDYIATHIGVVGEEKFPNEWHWRNCNIVTPQNHCASSMTVYRISKKLAQSLYDRLKTGDTGHHEVFVTTHAKDCGFLMENIPDSMVGCSDYVTKLSMNDLNKRNAIYHPVKFRIANDLNFKFKESIIHNLIYLQTYYLKMKFILFFDILMQISGFDLRMHYDDRYVRKRASSESEVDVLNKLIVQEIRPSSVADIGCGTGGLLLSFEQTGIRVLGLDGSFACKRNLRIQPKNFVLHDLRKVYQPAGRYDVAICFLVGEHLEEKYSDRLIETLSHTSDCVIFSAARLGQPGYRHINLKPNHWWIDKFKDRGYVLQREMTDKFRESLKDAIGVREYLRSNLMFFKKYE